MSSKPEIILIPGAWHTPTVFSPLLTLLHTHKYTTHPLSLPSIGASPPLQSFDADVSLIRSTVASILERGVDVVMFFHSYGGVPGCEALAEYISDLEGRKSVGEVKKSEGWGKVRRLVFCAAFVLPKGGSLMAALGGRDLPWFRVEGDITNPATPEMVFYNDLSPEVAAQYVSALLPHSYPTFRSVLTVEPWRYIPSTYIVCEKDLAIPVQAQEGMISAAKAKVGEGEGGGFDVIERCDAGHSPFLSMPEWLSGCVIRATKGDESSV